MINSGFNRLILHPAFNRTINEINKLNIQLPPTPVSQELDFNLYNFPPDGVISSVEKLGIFKLDPKQGEVTKKGDITVCAYDESVNKFTGLEGTAFLTSHSLVILHKIDYRELCKTLLLT